MKKIIILSVLLTLILTGALYGTNQISDMVANMTVEEVYMNIPGSMPDIVIDPMVGFTLY